MEGRHRPGYDATPRAPGRESSAPFREIAVGSETRVMDAGDFRIINTTLPRGFRIPPHTHGLHNLAFTMSGGVTETFERDRVQCRPGNVLLKPAGIVHSDVFDDRETTTLQVEWPPDASRASARSLDEVLLFREGSVPVLAARLHAELQTRDDATPVIAEGLALELLGQILRSRTPAREAGVPRWLSRVRDQLHDAPAGGFAIRDLAREAGVSADYLARRFRQAYGTTLGKYLRRVRLENAAAELATGDPRLAEVALRAGFSDQAHFTREFKRAFGMPPGAYRRRAVPPADPGED
ncbi:AraC family transcriptional regulator [Longimicrobium sp.]|uniref:helix-turn-helix transcriptional regulator n=1 Tax=Longimicrobium sp. TaxID=2029185 RepID=UPI003B3ADBD0